ncbi:RPC3-like protein [Mya arenaria]|uniref:DNA-directed RNA polymerase III subunit RPC3 n=1 Tax=Mya arenaria TaxID=6604 RepID=A0ABY7DVE6_MYAAR|nr:RPC3-like protein [Mya arenaria]
MAISMSKNCKCILHDHFGELAETVGYYLSRKSACHLRDIINGTKVPVDRVKKVLSILIQQNLVEFEKNKRGQTEYMLNHDRVMWRNRIPRYIHCGKSLYGDAAELVIEDIVQNGQVTMIDTVENVTDKLNEALENADVSVVYEKFKCLAQTHFLQQCVNPLDPPLKNEMDERDVTSLYTVPPLTSGSKKRKHSVGDSDQPQAKRIKTEPGTQASTDEVYWRINYSRFHQYFRDQMLIKAMSSKIDKRAGDILQTMLRLSEVKSEELALTTSPLAFNEIFHALPKELNISRHTCEQYLNIMADDSMSFVMKVGESGGGMYIVNMMKALETLCQAHIESVVQERFGSKSLRIFRVLLLKKHLEQKQIEELVMIPAKEAKELLYNMFAQNYEVSKTADHAPARTFYLFSVNLEQLARMLLQHALKAHYNAMVKREMETRENRRLMEKQERVDAIIASLEANKAEDVQKEEILQTITPAEKSQLTRIRHMINMLDQSELQLDETIFILETYIQYCEEKQKSKF